MNRVQTLTMTKAPMEVCVLEVIIIITFPFFLFFICLLIFFYLIIFN